MTSGSLSRLSPSGSRPPTGAVYAPSLCSRWPGLLPPLVGFHPSLSPPGIAQGALRPALEILGGPTPKTPPSAVVSKWQRTAPLVGGWCLHTLLLPLPFQPTGLHSSFSCPRFSPPTLPEGISRVAATVPGRVPWAPFDPVLGYSLCAGGTVSPLPLQSPFFQEGSVPVFVALASVF